MSNATPASSSTLAVVPLPGLHLDSLGLGLAALGLLSLCSRRWQSVRGGWRGSVFYLAGGPATEAELLTYIGGVGERGEWSTYQKGWDNHQKADTKAKSGRNTALWRAREADEKSLPLLQSHIAPASRLSFNPLFGTGGNAGKRDFANGWAKAKGAIMPPVETKRKGGKKTVAAKREGSSQAPPEDKERAKLNADLAAFLRGEPGICLADFNSGCWFGAANKAFNSGTAKPFRDGQLSPWGMTLACEAFGLFQGSPARYLGSARRATGAFPFVTTGAAPTAAGEAGKNLGELWLPVWEQPMSLPEVIALFQRGRAQVNGKGAITPPAFAAAILQRGVDAGIREFRRFLLLRTTSENTFESRLASVVPVAGEAEASTAAALTRMLGLRDSLPADRKKGKRWIYAGLRGPLDEALVTLAETFGNESLRTENARAAVDTMISSLRVADRNRAHRLSKKASPPRAPIRFQQLPGTWAAFLLDKNGGDACAEARIGLALATLWGAEQNKEKKKEGAARLLAYWLGVQMRGPFWNMPEEAPLRRVWGAGTLTANLAAVLQRRLIEEEPSAEPPFDSWHRACVDAGDIEMWLSGALDDAEVERWMMRFSLFDWNKDNITSVDRLLGHADPLGAVSGSLALFALFKPLFQTWLLSALLPAGSKREAAKVGPLPGIVAQLARGDVIAAAQLARNAYHAAGIEPAKLHSYEFAGEDPQRLAAALLIPARRSGITEVTFDGLCRPVPALAHRWISPRKQVHNAHTP
jgi:CRISPR-associated protein Csx17